MESTEKLWRSYRSAPKDAELRNQLVEQYMPIVRYQAQKLTSRLPDHVEYDDLLSGGVLGLIGAIEAFDLDRGIKFETYCVLRIRGAMLDELRATDWVPRLVRSRARKLHAAEQDLQERLGREATPAELAAEMQVSLREIDKRMGEANTVGLVSLHKKCYETESKDVREIDVLPDARAADPQLRAVNHDRLTLFTRGLNRTEQRIVLLYYYEQLTMREIATTLGVSEGRVSQLHTQLKARLRASLQGRQSELRA